MVDGLPPLAAGLLEVCFHLLVAPIGGLFRLRDGSRGPGLEYFRLKENQILTDGSYCRFCLVRIRQGAVQSYQGYDDLIRRLRNRIKTTREKVQELMARQGHMLEKMALEELTRRRTRLEEFQVKARFAMADNYDRATEIQQQEQEGQ